MFFYFIIIVNFVLCITYKLVFIMYICIGKNTVYTGFGTYLWFQASTGGSWNISPVEKGGLPYFDFEIIYSTVSHTRLLPTSLIVLS